MAFHYDPHNVEVLRLRTEGRCATLDELTNRLKTHTLEPEDFKEDFDRLHQPDVVALAAAIIHHLPDNDPRFIDVERIGDLRRVDLSEMRTLKASLAATPQLAIAQLQTIAGILRKLVASLPE